jgi:hypothetical protein
MHVRAAHEAQAKHRDFHDGFRATNIFGKATRTPSAAIT